MDYYTCALLFVVCSLIYFYFKKSVGYFEELGVPYIPVWPILGSFQDILLQKKHKVEILQEIYNQNPDAKYVGAFNMTQPAFFIRDLKLVKSICIKNFDSFAERQPFGNENLDPLFARTLISLKGKAWKDLRALLSPMFRSSKLRMAFGLMVECAKNFVKHMDEQPSEKMKMVSTLHLFERYATDAIVSYVFGIEINSSKDPNNEFFVQASKAWNLGTLLTLKMHLSRIFPGLLRVLRVRLVSQEITDYFTETIRKAVKTRDENGITRPDLLQLMMDARGQDTKDLKLDTIGIAAQAFGFFFAGFDTVAATLCVLAHLLALHPEVQSKMLAEIDEVMDRSNGEPTYDDVHAMEYLDAAFNETMRLHGQGPMLDRTCTLPFQLPPALPGCKPITLQPGDTVWIPSAAIHRDPKYYVNPDEFDPDRYLGKKVTPSPTNIGFGLGPRMCVGNRFAVLGVKTLLVHFMSKYTFESNEKTCNPLVYSPKNSFSVHVRGGSWLTIKRRNRM